MRLGAGQLQSACVFLLPPRLPAVGGACDVRPLNPETAAATEAAGPGGCRWWALPGSEREARNPEAEAGSRPSFGEWPFPGLGSRVGAWAARYEGPRPPRNPGLTVGAPSPPCWRGTGPHRVGVEAPGAQVYSATGLLSVRAPRWECRPLTASLALGASTYFALPL